jgi:hypothetical protein
VNDETPPARDGARLTSVLLVASRYPLHSFEGELPSGAQVIVEKKFVVALQYVLVAARARASSRDLGAA